MSVTVHVHIASLNSFPAVPPCPPPSPRKRGRIGLGYLLIAWWRGQLYRDEDGRLCVRSEHLEAIRRDWGCELTVARRGGDGVRPFA